MNPDTIDGPKRILVTGVGGQPAFDLARELVKAGHEVIAVDADPLAPGLLIPGVIAQVTAPCHEPDYRASLTAVCEQLRPDAIFSGVEQELPALLELQPALDGLGVRTWLPPGEAVAACVDKARFTRVLTEHGLPTPRTWLPHRVNELWRERDLVVKPRRGQGAKHVHYAASAAQARVLCELVPEPIIQERLTGREFTADCLTGRDGRSSVVLRYRLLVKGGLAIVSETFHDPAVAEAVHATLSALGMQGPCCVQGFVCENGEIQITEANARFAGAFLTSVAAGADLVGQALRGMFGLEIEHEELTYQPGIRLTKFVDTLATTGPHTAPNPVLTTPEGE